MCPQQSDAVRLSRVLGDHRSKKKRKMEKEKPMAAQDHYCKATMRKLR